MSLHSAMPKPKKPTKEEKEFNDMMTNLEPAFKLFDGDSDGKLTAKELLEFLKAVALPL